MLNSSSDKSLQDLSQRVIISNKICPTLNKFLGKKEIIIEEIDGLYDALLRHCHGLLSKTDLQSLRVTHDNIFPSTHGWAFRKGTPYLRYINKYIIWFHEFGLQKKWSAELTTPPRKLGIRFDGASVQDDDSKSSKFFGQFVLWILGIAFSISCFIAELLVHGMCAKRTKYFFRKIRKKISKKPFKK